jgi:hypothetical protein
MLPEARQEKLVTQEVGDELVVFDLTRNRVHRLNRTTALVWRHCDGRTGVAELAELLADELELPEDERLVWLALAQLEKAHLLHGHMQWPADREKLSRRQAIALGLAGAAALLLPGCESVTAPDPALTPKLDVTPAAPNCENVAAGQCPTGACRTTLFVQGGGQTAGGACTQVIVAGAPACRCVTTRPDPGCAGSPCDGRCPNLYRSRLDRRAGRNPIRGKCIAVAAGCTCRYQYKFKA